MKKLLTAILSVVFLSTLSAKAEIGIGVSGALHAFDASGTETTRSSGEKNNGSHKEDAMVPEVFVEAILDNGAAFGVSFIPKREIGTKSRSDSNSDGDTGTYKAEAELGSVAQIYADIPLTTVANFPIYAKLGIQHATINTLESLNSGSSYPNKDVMGYSVGLGTKGDVPFGSNLYYKAELSYTDFGTYEADSDSSPANKVSADLEFINARLSIGMKF